MSTPPPFPDPLGPVPPPDSPPLSPLVYRPPVAPPEELPVLSHRAMAWAAVALIVLGVGLAVGLLVAFGAGQHSGQLEAIKTAGTIVVGAGGAAALWLTARRQRTSELSLNQVRAAHAATIADAEARRITDLYGKAADQLGSPQAPARLAGLYALERLAQDNPGQRQTIVDLLCAYLRMPYDPPRRAPGRRPSGVPRPLLGGAARQRAPVRLTPPAPRAATATEAEQEYQVRRTAQVILFRHLLHGGEDKPAVTFWPGINLDLTGAVLGPANLVGCRLVTADFTGATFTGDVWFTDGQFALNAVFTGARFMGEASFTRARFDHDTSFVGATFDSEARFTDTRFGEWAKFDRADFRGAAEFTGARFAHDASFPEARFGDRAEFRQARVAGWGRFEQAWFAGDASFFHTNFRAGALFRAVRFAGETAFGRATFGRTDFSAAEFGSAAVFRESSFTEEAAFGKAKFSGVVEFTRAEFDTADFGGARFAEGVTFEDAKFAADVQFGETEFADAVGFRAAQFAGRARFRETTFGDACGFPGARFGGDAVFEYVRFGGPVSFLGAEFARPPRIGTVWARLDERKAAGTWPPGMVVRELGEHPFRLPEGRWGMLEDEQDADVPR